MGKETKYDGSMTDWAEAARNLGYIEQANSLAESKQVKLDGQKMLETLGLPRLHSVTIPLNQFLDRPNEAYHQVRAKLYHVSLLSGIKGKERIRAFPFSQSRVVNFIHENITQQEIADFTLSLKEFHPNMYGGNIVVSPNGSLILEAVTENHINVVLGNKKIIAFGYRDHFLRTLGIYQDNSHTEKLRNLKLERSLLQTINCIPRDFVGSDGEISYHPGYYEFVLVRRGKNGLRPVFIDYRDKDVYQLKSI